MASLRSLDSVPDESLYNNVAGLNNFDAGSFGELANIAYAFLTQSIKPAEAMAQLEAFAESRRINVNQMKNVIRSLLTVLRGALRKNLQPKLIVEDLVQLGLSSEKADVLGRAWSSNLVAMSRMVLGQTLVVNKLVDLDWRFGVTGGTEGMRQVGSAFLQLKLVLDKGGKPETVFMVWDALTNTELSLQQFYQFLRDMEQAKSSLDYFS